jgi:hypothetical protein
VVTDVMPLPYCELPYQLEDVSRDVMLCPARFDTLAFSLHCTPPQLSFTRVYMHVDADARVCGCCMYRYAKNYHYLTSTSWRSGVYT